MGLVETGVGVLPAGGGCKEMTLRAVDAAAAFRESGRGESVGADGRAAPELRNHRDGEGVHLGRGGAAARHAVCPGDRITMNRERLLLRCQADWRAS